MTPKIHWEFSGLEIVAAAVVKLNPRGYTAQSIRDNMVEHAEREVANGNGNTYVATLGYVVTILETDLYAYKGYTHLAKCSIDASLVMSNSNPMVRVTVEQVLP